MELFVFNGPCTAKNASCFMKIKLLSKILKISDCGNQMALEMIRMNKSAICILMHFTSGMFLILRSEFFQRNRRLQDSSIIPVEIIKFGNYDRSSAQKFSQPKQPNGTWHFKNYKDYNFYHIIHFQSISCFEKRLHCLLLGSKSL